MGRSGWEDEETWTPDRSSRGPHNRDRMERGNPDPRAYDRSDRRSGRSADNGGWDRSRSSSREDEWRGSSNSNGRMGNSGNGGRRGSSGDLREDSYADRTGGRSRSGYGAQNDRTMRSPRPPARGNEDAWASPQRGGASGGRYRQPPNSPNGQSGGLWGDDTSGQQRRPRPGGAVAANGRGAGGRPNRDEMRAERLRQMSGDDLPEKQGGFTAGKAVLTIFLALILGAVGGFAYFKISTPAVHANNSVSPGSTSTPQSFLPATDGTVRTIITVVVQA